MGQTVCGWRFILKTHDCCSGSRVRWLRPQVGTYPPRWRVPEQSAASQPAPGTVTPGLWSVWRDHELLGTFFMGIFIKSLHSIQVWWRWLQSDHRPITVFHFHHAQQVMCCVRESCLSYSSISICCSNSNISCFDAPIVSTKRRPIACRGYCQSKTLSIQREGKMGAWLVSWRC